MKERIMNKISMNVIDVISLDCPASIIDSEALLMGLMSHGVTVSPDAADVVVINAGGVFDEALLAHVAEVQEHQKLVVTGCRPRHREIAKQHMPHANVFYTDQEYTSIINGILSLCGISNHDDECDATKENPKLLLTPPHYAYLNVSTQGVVNDVLCDSEMNALVYRSPDEITANAEWLVESGVQELILTSKNTSGYNYADAEGGRHSLASLCKMLGKFNVLLRIENVVSLAGVDGLLPLMKDSTVIPYLDIDLAARHLEGDGFDDYCQSLLQLMRQWRAEIPELVVRASCYVGVSCERSEHMNALIAFVEQAQCYRLSVMLDNHLDGQASDVANLEYLNQLQSTITANYLGEAVGAIMPIIIDDTVSGEIDGEVVENIALGRAVYDAPVQDGIIQVEDIYGAVPGQIVHVEVLESTGDALIAIPG